MLNERMSSSVFESKNMSPTKIGKRVQRFQKNDYTRRSTVKRDSIYKQRISIDTST